MVFKVELGFTALPHLPDLPARGIVESPTQKTMTAQWMTDSPGSEPSITIRCKIRAKVIRSSSIMAIQNYRAIARPPSPPPAPKVLPRQSSSPSWSLNAAQAPPPPDSRTPKLLFPRWPIQASFSGRFGGLGIPVAAFLVFERADSRVGDRSLQGANFEGPTAIEYGRNQGHPSPLQCRSGPEASQPFSN
jgi:hypothetical protein